MPLDYARPDIEDEPIIRSNNEIVIDTVQNKRAIKRPNSDFFEVSNYELSFNSNF